jgi:hypothetical protein
MTYIKTNLPELNTLKEYLKDPEKIEYYKKYDVYIGSIESVEYLREALKRTNIVVAGLSKFEKAQSKVLK